MLCFPTMLEQKFFNRDPLKVAFELLGKVLRVKHNGIILSARIIETEAYYLNDKASHASLGFTEKRKALFMPAGTIYMYHSHGNPSLNISCRGKGNAVLIKSAMPYLDPRESADIQQKMLTTMLSLNPKGNSNAHRPLQRLCSGQTLLCRSLGLVVKDWDQKQFDADKFYIDDVSIKITKIIQTTRLGIPLGRDEHLPYRIIDYNAREQCTKNPLGKKKINEMNIIIGCRPIYNV